MFSQRKNRIVGRRVGINTTLMECDVCGPLGFVLGGANAEHLFFTAHVIEHQTGKTVTVKEQP